MVRAIEMTAGLYAMFALGDVMQCLVARGCEVCGDVEDGYSRGMMVWLVNAHMIWHLCLFVPWRVGLTGSWLAQHKWHLIYAHCCLPMFKTEAGNSCLEVWRLVSVLFSL